MPDWDISQVTTMWKVFSMYYDGKVNYCDIPDISGWNVSHITDFVSNSLSNEECNLI